MKTFFSILREIKKGKEDTVIKILSLTIGRVVGIFLCLKNEQLLSNKLTSYIESFLIKLLIFMYLW